MSTSTIAPLAMVFLNTKDQSRGVPQSTALVKALRRAIESLPDDNINRERWWYQEEAKEVRADITAILNQGRSVGDNKGE